MTPDDTLFCPAVIEADGYKVSDAHERSDQTFSFRQILDQSSNVGISLSVQKMTDGFTKLYEHIQKYNLCEKTGVDYPGEASGHNHGVERELWAGCRGDAAPARALLWCACQRWGRGDASLLGEQAADG